MRLRTVATLAAAILLLGVGAVGASAAGTLTDSQQLGKALFFDEDLSLNKNQSCATCHAPSAGWVGPDSDINEAGSVYEGSVLGEFGDRKPPSSAYATQSPILSVDRKGLFVGGNFWDGRATGEKLGNPAADQAQGPFLNPKEQALPDSACVVYRACQSDAYAVSVEGVWGADACSIAWPDDVETQCTTADGYVALSGDDRQKSNGAYDKLALSIAAYEGSSEVNAFNSRYDLSLGGKATLTKQERLGFALFQGKGQCKACHLSSGKQALFTDFTFDNLGIPKNPQNPATIADPTWADPGLGGFLATRADYASYAEENLGKHKVPTLRNVGLGNPGIVKAYGHNGYFKSLEAIVHFYNTRDVLDTCPGAYTEAQALAANCWPEPEVAENVNTAELGDLGLTPDEEAAIVAFLRTLSDAP